MAKNQPVPLYEGVVEGVIEIIIPGMNDDELCQYGKCDGCGATILANRKRVYCPFCGVPIGLS